MTVEADQAEVDEFEQYAEEAQAEEREAPVEPEPAPEPEPVEAEAESEPAEPEPEPESKPETVPLGTFLEQKNAAQNANSQVKELTEQLNALREEIQSLKPQEPEVSFDDDPFGYLNKQNERLGQKLDQVAEKFDSQEQLTKKQQFVQAVQAEEQKFAQAHPDYNEAMDHLKTVMIEEIKLRGFNEAEAEQVLNQEAEALVIRHVQSGSNPFRAAYEWAKSRGYKPKAEQPKTLDDLARRQTSAQTLQGKGGKAPAGDLDIDDINALSDDDFDKMFLGTEGDKLLKKMMS